MNASALPLQYIVNFTSASNDKSFSRCFSNANVLHSRELALTYFLEIILDDCFFVDQDFASLVLQYTLSNETVEITNSLLYDNVLWLVGLTRELELLCQEGIKAPVVAYDMRHPNFVTILNTYHNRMQTNNSDVSYILAADFGVFFRGKTERLLIA